MDRAMYNLHNHTPFSDGAYSIDELIEAHLATGLPISGVGICDHLFGTPSSREITSERDFERLFARETRNYVEAVRTARQQWAGKMQVLCGAEINWPVNKNMLGPIRQMLDGIDYVLFEYTDWAGLTTLANQARRWPCPVGLAHAAVPKQFPTTSLDQVVRTLANARIFYEINSKFLPLDEHDPWFHVLPQHRVLVTIGTDTHDDLRVIHDVPRLYEYAARRGLAEKMLVPPVRETTKATVSAQALT